MKSSTLKLAVLLLIANFSLISCKKGHVLPKDVSVHVDHGVITQDLALYYTCASCGGYLIKFDKDTSVIYHTIQSLDNFGITVNSKFPVKATIGWKPDTAIKVPHYITITSIKIDN